MQRFIRTTQDYWYFVIYVSRAKLRTEVANSFLNRLWWVLDPLLNMCVYSFVFGKIFGMKEEYYPVFIFSGLLMWNFFSRTVNSSVKIIRNNKNIVSKIYIPKHVLLLQEMFVNWYKMLFSILVLVIMMIFFRVPVTWKVLYMVPIMGELLLCTFTVGVILMHLGVFIDDLSYATGILLKLLLYLSGVMYHIDTRLDPELAMALKVCNPMAMLIDSMHKVVLYGQNPDILLMIMWLFILFIISVVGILTINKYENSYVKVI